MSMKFTITPTHRTWLASLVFLALLSAACTRSVAPSDAEIAAAASPAAIDNADAGLCPRPKRGNGAPVGDESGSRHGHARERTADRAGGHFDGPGRWRGNAR